MRTGRTLHNTAERIEHGLGCEVLRGNQIDEVFLAILLLWRESGQS